MMNTDRDLHDDVNAVARVRAGEREAFGPLWQRYSPSILRLCQRLLGPVPEAQDLAQETALQAYLELPHLREPARFGAWLHAIAANLARMAPRRRRAVSLEAITTDATIQSLLWANHPPLPDDALLAREVHHRIVQALNDLSTVNRAAVVHFYLEGYSYIELAEVLGVPVSTVKGRLFAGRQHLKQALAPVAREVLDVTPRRSARHRHAGSAHGRGGDRLSQEASGVSPPLAQPCPALADGKPRRLGPPQNAAPVGARLPAPGNDDLRLSGRENRAEAMARRWDAWDAIMSAYALLIVVARAHLGTGATCCAPTDRIVLPFVALTPPWRENTGR